MPVSKRLRERVLEVIKQLDYHPNQVARSLKIRQTKTIGMVISDITNPFVPQMIRGAEDAAWQRKYMLITFNTDDQLERERQVISALRGRQVDGILLMAAAGSDHAHIRAVHDSGIPIVCVEREIRDLTLDCVIADNMEGACVCVRHLISLGHSRIAMLNASMESESTLQRLLGYRKALEEATLPFEESFVITQGFRMEDGYRAGLDLLSRDPLPTAVFTSNAAIALGMLRALKEKNLRCPEDVAMATFDDPFFAEALRPALTAVAQPSFEIGARGMELLLARIGDPTSDCERIVLPTTLNVRESCGSMRAGAS